MLHESDQHDVSMSLKWVIEFNLLSQAFNGSWLTSQIGFSIHILLTLYSFYMKVLFLNNDEI
jgi:hypothetical protein